MGVATYKTTADMDEHLKRLLPLIEKLENFFNPLRMLLGKRIKELRIKQGLLQRQLAATLEIDTPMFSKIERGDRRAKREQVIKLANQFNVDENELLTLWIADKILDAIEEDNDKLKQAAINVVKKVLT